jgi:hypothetical protein
MINIIYFSTVTLLFYLGERSIKEGRMTIKLLYGMQDSLGDGDLEHKIQKMISQISDTKVEFSCGLVDFNWKFFFKVSVFWKNRPLATPLLQTITPQFFLTVRDISHHVLHNFSSI